MVRRGASAVVVAGLLILAQVMTVAAAPSAPGGRGGGSGPGAPIDKELQEGLEAGTATILVVEFAAKADLKAPAKIKDRGRRGQAVLDALEATASKSQGEARSLAAKLKGARVTSYWLTNVLVVETDDAKALDKLARRLARVKGVTAVRAPKVYPLVKPVETKVAILAAAGDPEWGVARIRADEAWADGVLGSGIVVANVDTGVDYLHPAIVEQYRGNLGGGLFDHDYDWWDPTGICGPEPCDNAGHGTHTMGTMVGGDGPGPFTPDIGVAPGARWIAAKGCEDFFCTEESLLSAGQFILAPTDLNGENPDPDARPDIVNNSWGGGPGDPFYLETVQAWRAAGIVPVFASGNPGPFCGEGGSPGDFLESFSAGATDSNDQIAEFSGRGPSVYGKVNPDISAPGVDVVSSVPGGGYAAFSGTSMAAPHTSGALALMLSAEAALRGDVAASTDAVRATALDILDDQCGGDEDGDPNNVYGDGRIDAKAAVDLVATGGTLAGTVTDSVSGDPVAGSTVTADDGTRQFSVITGANGDYDLFLAAGTYQVVAEAFGYAPGGAADVVIVTDQTTRVDVALVPLPRYELTGTVRAAEDASPIEGATVQALGTPVPAATTDATGSYTLILPLGTYAIRGSAGGCTEVQVVEGAQIIEDTRLDFVLGRKIDAFGHGCRPIPFAWVDAPTDTALYGDDWVGRLRLPFGFTFYGETYDEVWLSDNGYVNFLGPDQYNAFPVSIPNPGPPNAAVYALWRDLYLDADSTIAYTTVGIVGARTFVIEVSDARVRGATAPIDFEIKLHEGGETVDLLYGNNAANPGDGRGATIGIEDAAGADALEFSFGEGLLTPNSAFRFEVVPVGTVHGTVTDANDGEPLAGATVRAAPGLVSARTAEDGTYVLRAYPGTYDVTISAPGYLAETTPLTLADGDDVTLDAALDAGIPAVDPVEILVEAEYGDAPVTRTVTLSNLGSAPFDWEARERGGGSIPAEIPVGTAGKGMLAGRGTDSRTRPATWTGPIAVAPSDTGPGGGATAAVFLDFLPWGSDALLQVLDANGVAYDLLGSESMAEVDLTQYQFVILSSDQPQDFYDRYVANADRFAGYVQSGGLLVVEAASNGWNFGDFSGAPLPGGVSVGGPVFDDLNDVAAPDHPLMAGVPDPFFGTFASHTIFENLPADATIIATSTSTGEPTLAEYRVGGGTVVALAQTMEFAWMAGQDGAIILENLVPYAVAFYRDVPWLAEDPSAGTLGIGGATEVTITVGDPTLAPGSHTASVVFVTTAPKPKSVTVDVTLSIALPDSWGGLAGTVRDAHSGEPLPGVTVTLRSQWDGQPLDVTATTAGDGTYSLIGPSGSWPLEFAKDGYVGLTRTETVTAGTTRTGVDAALHAAIPHATVEGGPFDFILTEGRTASGTITVSNPEGHADLQVEVGEVDLGGPSSDVVLPAATSSRTPTAAVDPSARKSRGFGTAAAGTVVPPRLAADGDVLAAWPTGLGIPWAVGYTGDVWIGDPEQRIDVQYSTAGERGIEFATDWADAWGADMAYDAGRGLLWQVNVGGDNGIYGLDPADGSVEQVITGSPWGGISQRGLAYDPDADVFYIGGWNEGIVYRVAGLSHPTPGETLNQCTPPDPSISGLAWNRSFGMLWEATNSEQDTIWLIDPITCDAVRGIPHPDGGGFNGAGIEIDVVGNLWTVGQGSQNAYLVETGLPTFSDVEWLSVDPTSAVVAPDGSVDLDVTVDTTGLVPGVHRAIVVVLTNDPTMSTVQVPVTLIVPAYQQGIDAGGGDSFDGEGNAFAADRGYGAGPFGYVGTSSTRSTSAPIEGTEDDGLYQDLRTAMSAYRFDVPDGTYRVDLLFAEIQAARAGARVFSVNIEGDAVLANLDVYAEAGGRNIALERSFLVTVTDGRLDIDFVAQRGDKPIVNAILVTEMPEAAPGT